MSTFTKYALGALILVALLVGVAGAARIAGTGLNTGSGDLVVNSSGVDTVSNDTNVTGSITGSTLTLGWTGTLADSRIASAATWNAKLGSYDAFTHPAYGGAATSSLLTFSDGFISGNASSTISGNLHMGSLVNGVLYITTGGLVATNANLFFDTSLVRLAVGSSTPQRSLVASSTASTECNLTDGATITMDLRYCNQGEVTIASTGRDFEFSHETEALGQPIRVVVCQDGTGSRTITTWDSSIRWAGGSAPTLTTTASHCDVIAGFTTVATGTPVILLDKAQNF